MNASPRRCSSGPQKRIGMRLEPAWASMSATCADSTLEGSRSRTPASGSDFTATPCSSSSPVTTPTSRICGTLRSTLGDSPSNDATIAFDTKFFAPRTVIVPSSGVPPLTYSTSFMSPGRPLAKPMVGGAPRARARAPGRGRPFRQRGSLCANVRHPEIIHPRTRAHRRGAPRPRYRHDPRPPAVRILRRRLRDPRRAVRWTPRYPPVRFRGSPLMSTSVAPPTDQQVASGNSKSRVIVASLIGTSIEFYDFYAYATAAVPAYPTVFFASADPTYALLQSFAVFGVAFVARPVGSILFGHFGDRVGRKGTLVASLLTMGVATVLIGTLPPSSTPGWAVLSPALLVLMRFCQGLGLGGEWSGAALLATENAPEGKRAVWGTFPQLGAPIGFILANTVFLALAETLTDAQFLAWGWRVPFLASAVLVIVGLWV